MDTKHKAKAGALRVLGRIVRVGGAVIGWVQSEGVVAKIIAARDPDSDGGTDITPSEGLALAADLTDEASITDLRARIAAALVG